MSPSSSGSWSGARGADIIDLDRYMRGNVRPSRTLSIETKNERLVVDAGGPRAPLSSASGDARHKRHSHDSGVDDGSYRRRRAHRPHRHSQDGQQLRSSREASSRGVTSRASAASLRAFRAACREALRDQQRQIACLAQLCERHAENAKKSGRRDRTSEKNVQEKSEPEREAARGARAARSRPASSEDTSDLSSSSRITGDRRKDKDRSQECKTYKIIMNKLDELNRMFLHRPRPAPRATRVRTPSSTSVSVCDKLTATDAPRDVLASQLSRRAASPAPGGRARARAVARAVAVDIAPRAPNVHTESIVKCESSAEASPRSASSPRAGVDLEDPLHLYAQAKRLRTFTASTRRSHSVDCTHAEQSRAEPRAPSLCSVCRSYWRWLRRSVEPMFARAADACDYS